MADLGALELKLEIARANVARAEAELALARLRMQQAQGSAPVVAGGHHAHGRPRARHSSRSRSRDDAYPPTRRSPSPPVKQSRDAPNNSSRPRSPGAHGGQAYGNERHPRSPNSASRAWFEGIRSPNQITSKVSKCLSLGELCDMLLSTQDNLTLFNSYATSASLARLGTLAGKCRVPEERERLPKAFDMMARHCEEVAGKDMDNRAISCIFRGMGSSGMLDPRAEDELKGPARRLMAYLVRVVRESGPEREAQFKQEYSGAWINALKAVEDNPA